MSFLRRILGSRPSDDQPDDQPDERPDERQWREDLAWARQAYVDERRPDAERAAQRVDALTRNDPSGEAHVLRAWMRLKGFGFAPDADLMVADLAAAAERGNGDAHFELSVLLDSGQGGVRPDQERARAHLRHAVELDHPRALYNVAASHATGTNGFAKDEALAFDLYRRAADRGNARAALTAGVMAIVGQGTERDDEVARDLLIAAERGGVTARGVGYPDNLVAYVEELTAPRVTAPTGPIGFTVYDRVGDTPAIAAALAERPGFPAEVIEAWRTHGTGLIGADGFVRLIDPERYLDALGESFTDTHGAVPILATGMGDLVVWQDGVLRHVLYRVGDIRNLTVTPGELLGALEDEDFVERTLLRTQYSAGVERLGRPELYEAFFYAPFLPIGGREHPDNLRRGDLAVSLSLFTQMLGKASLIPGQPPSEG